MPVHRVSSSSTSVKRVTRTTTAEFWDLISELKQQNIIFECDEAYEIYEELQRKGLFYDKKRSAFFCEECECVVLGDVRNHLINHHKKVEGIAEEAGDDNTVKGIKKEMGDGIKRIFPAAAKNIRDLTTDLPMFTTVSGWGCSRCDKPMTKISLAKTHCRRGACKNEGAFPVKCKIAMVNIGRSAMTYKMLRNTEPGIVRAAIRMQEPEETDGVPRNTAEEYEYLDVHAIHAAAVAVNVGVLDKMYIELGWYSMEGNVDLLEVTYGRSFLRRWLDIRDENLVSGITYAELHKKIQESFSKSFLNVGSDYTDEARRAVMLNVPGKGDGLSCLEKSARRKYSAIGATLILFVFKYRKYLLTHRVSSPLLSDVPEVFTPELTELLERVENGEDVYLRVIRELLKEYVEGGRHGVSNKMVMYIRASTRTLRMSLESPDFITQRCSAVEYLSRLSILHMNKFRATGTQPAYRLVSPNSMCAFGSVVSVHMQGTAAKIRRDRKRFVWVAVENEELQLNWQAGEMTLSVVRDGLVRLLRDLEALQKNTLLEGEVVSSLIRDENINEELGNRIGGMRLASRDGEAEVFLLRKNHAWLMPNRMWTDEAERYMERYVAAHTEFMHLLFPAVHLLSGPPNRGTEKMAYTLANSPNWLRSVYYSRGEIFLHTAYNKSKKKKETGLHYTGSRLTKILLTEVLVVRPFLFEMMHLSEQSSRGRAGVDSSRVIYAEYLFVCSWKRMNASVLCDCVKKATYTYMGGVNLKISDYRHLAAAIADKFVVRGVTEAWRVRCLQMGHSESTNMSFYGGSVQDPHGSKSWDMAEHRQNCRLFQELFGVEPPKVILFQAFYSGLSVFREAMRAVSLLSPAPILRVAAPSDISPLTRLKAEISLLSRIDQEELSDVLDGILGRRVPTAANTAGDAPTPATEEESTVPQAVEMTERDSLEKLQQLYPGSDFRSPAQRIAITTVLNAKENVVCALPTGMGKSAIFFCKILHDFKKKVNVIVVPTNSLVEDIGRRAIDHGIFFARDAHNYRGEGLIILVTDQASTDGMLAHLAWLEGNGALGTIFYDEAHEIVLSQNYRDVMVSLMKLARFRVPHVFLSGSLPLGMEDDVVTSVLGPGAVWKSVRTDCQRKNLQYSVVALNGEQGVEQRASELVRDFDGCGRVILYFNNKRTLLKYQEVLLPVIEERDAQPGAVPLGGVSICHGGWQRTNREEEVNDWQDGARKVMLATSAFGLGIDQPDVRVVINIGFTYGAMDFIQQTGRAGRDGHLSQCLMLYSLRDEDGQIAYLRQKDVSTSSLEEVRKYVHSTSCRRRFIAARMGETPFLCGGGNAVCDVCHSSALSRGADASRRASMAYANEIAMYPERIMSALMFTLAGGSIIEAHFVKKLGRDGRATLDALFQRISKGLFSQSVKKFNEQEMYACWHCSLPLVLGSTEFHTQAGGFIRGCWGGSKGICMKVSLAVYHAEREFLSTIEPTTRWLREEEYIFWLRRSNNHVVRIQNCVRVFTEFVSRIMASR
ncbi:MAG: uncharacterized protein A8A55_1639 [Amphiamblys sp. WSBS2006]|nr:MAG: uncharacterized protein A8A55_1639 [Amphiamblys sp. WSBS2006]